MTRLNRRSNRSRGDIWLISGALPAASVPANPAAGPAPSRALWEPALAMSGATGAGASRTTLKMIIARRATHSAPATSQAVRSRAGSAAETGPPGAVDGPAGRPQRWQKRAWGERSARQPAQLRATRLAPQALQ